MTVVASAETFGNLVRRRRRELGMSQVELATSTKTGERFIVELEQGKATCQLGKALQVAHALGIRLTDQADQARSAEAELLKRCVAAARGPAAPADQREANIFLVAASLLVASHPSESAALRSAGESYFKTRPAERLAVEDVIGRGWVPGLPRLRDSLTSLLNRKG